MNRKDINELLDRLDYWAAKEKKWDNAFEKLSEAISSAYSAIVLDSNFAEAFIDGVCQTHPEIRDCLLFYVYDLPNMAKAEVTYNCQKYNAKNRKEFVTYLKRVMTSDE
jgi:hypothetical protein